MKGIDCLLEVTAHFYKAGDKTQENLEDFVDLASYGDFLGADCSEDYWDYTEAVKREEDSGVYLAVRRIEDEEHYTIKKDFIGFSFSTVNFGDFSDGRGSGVYHEEQTIAELLVGCEDALCEYAKEEQLKWIEDRKRLKSSTLKHTSLPDEPSVVKFILALDYNCVECGSYDCREWDTEVELVGRVDMSRIREIIV